MAEAVHEEILWLVRGAVQKRWFAANPRLRIGGPTNRWYEELDSAYEPVTMSSRLRAIQIPVLFGVALEDPVVNPSPVFEAAAGLPRGRAVRSPWLREIEAFLQGI